MSSSTTTYESMLTYLRRAEKQIDSTLDPFHCHHNYDNISDLQIYCDALSEHMCHELTLLTQPLSDDTRDCPKQSLESMDDHKCKSESTASFDSHSSQSAHLTNSDNSLVNTISSTSSDHKSRNYLNHNNYDISYHRLSQYENNHEIQLSLLTAHHLSIIVSTLHSKLLNYFYFIYELNLTKRKSIKSFHWSISRSILSPNSQNSTEGQNRVYFKWF